MCPALCLYGFTALLLNIPRSFDCRLQLLSLAGVQRTLVREP